MYFFCRLILDLVYRKTSKCAIPLFHKDFWDYCMNCLQTRTFSLFTGTFNKFRIQTCSFFTTEHFPVFFTKIATHLLHSQNHKFAPLFLHNRSHKTDHSLSFVPSIRLSSSSSLKIRSASSSLAPFSSAGVVAAIY